jgi:hypothetical protein
MRLREDCTDILFRYAVDILHWYVHRHDKKEEGGVSPPLPEPPYDPLDPRRTM